MSDLFQRPPEDPRTTETLFRLALAEDNEETRWKVIGALHWRGTREVFEEARKLVRSMDPKQRILGIDVLGQLGVPDRSFPRESVDLMLGVLEEEREPAVLESIGIALSHIRDPRAISPLAKLLHHPDADVRYACVLGVSGFEDQSAIDCLIELSQDEDSHVRDWATFGLGTLIETDTAEIREALLQRTSDEDFDTRGEALVGLARRHDPRVLAPLLQELQGDSVGSLSVEAARDLGNPELYPVLEELTEWWDVDPDLLQEALDACRPRIG